MLLTWHADPNAPLDSRNRSAYPDTPLQYAARSGNLRVASILVKAGAQIDAKGPGGRTALHAAVADSHLDMLHFLIGEGSEINTRDSEGASPLDDAVWLGSVDMAAILLANGAELNTPDTQTGATPVNEAAFRGHTSLVQYLLQFHPDLTITDKRGFSPLDNAVRMGKEDPALLLLAAEPKDRLTPEFFSRSLNAAIEKDESLLAGALLGQGASANEALPSGSTLLDAAAFTGAVKTVRVLLDREADPNLTGPNGTTPLEDASLKGFESIVTMLLDHGAQINHANSASGSTALYAAASFGKGSVVKALLERGANAGLCGKNRKSPYQAAIENGYPDVAALIQSGGGKQSCDPDVKPYQLNLR